MLTENGLVFVGIWKICLNFIASEFFGRQRECRFYTAGCGNKMAVTATGPRAANELGGPVIPGRFSRGKTQTNEGTTIWPWSREKHLTFRVGNKIYRNNILV